MYGYICISTFYISRYCGTIYVEYRITMNPKEAMSQSVKNETFVIAAITFPSIT